MFELWKERPYLGGKSGTGYGKVKLDYPEINSLSDDDYLKYVDENKELTCNFLDELLRIWK